MTTLSTIETTNYNRTILMLCARVDAYNMANDELMKLIDDQYLDDTGRAKGEFLGGNGQVQGHHVKGHIVENSGVDITKMSQEERAILSACVAEHQSSIETNGQYNVRQLAHWSKGFNGELYAKKQGRIARKNACCGIKIDKRKAITPKALANKEARATMTNAEYQKYLRAQRKASK